MATTASSRRERWTSAWHYPCHFRCCARIGPTLDIIDRALASDEPVYVAGVIGSGKISPEPCSRAFTHHAMSRSRDRILSCFASTIELLIICHLPFLAWPRRWHGSSCGFVSCSAATSFLGPASLFGPLDFFDRLSAGSYRTDFAARYPLERRRRRRRRHQTVSCLVFFSLFLAPA